MADSFRGWVVRDDDDQVIASDGVIVIDLYALEDTLDVAEDAKRIVEVIDAMPYREVANSWPLQRAHDKALEIISDLERAT